MGGSVMPTQSLSGRRLCRGILGRPSERAPSSLGSSASVLVDLLASRFRYAPKPSPASMVGAVGVAELCPFICSGVILFRPPD